MTFHTFPNHFLTDLGIIRHCVLTINVEIEMYFKLMKFVNVTCSLIC